MTVALLEAGIDCNGAETLDAMQSDNMCVADVAELSTRTGLTKNQLKGVVSSLASKGLVSANIEKPNGEPGVDQWLNTDALATAFDLMADGVEANAKKPAPKPARKLRGLDDRIIQTPGKLDDVKPTKEGSKRAILIQALQRGTTLEHLQELLGWNRETVSSALRTDVGAIGLGCERKGGKYFLLLPEGMKKLPLREATATRAAAVAACK